MTFCQASNRHTVTKFSFPAKVNNETAHNCLVKIPPWIKAREVR